MFKIQLIVLALALGLGIGLLVFPIQQKDFFLYEALTEQSNPDQEAPVCTQQMRENVHKQIWIQDQTPLYFSIQSKNSNLFFFKECSQIEIIEELEDVTCVLQEELFYRFADGTTSLSPQEGAEPWQKTRYLKAEQAHYNYQTHLFVADTVHLWEYQLAGHAPPSTFQGIDPQLEATAQSVEFILNAKELDFTAHKMHAIFYETEGVQL